MHYIKNTLLAFIVVYAFSGVTYASTTVGTIDPAHIYSWSNNDGWMNWGATGGNVQVTDTAVTGYVWDTATGWINLSPALGGVTNNNGTLGGYAWGDGVGWISFSGATIDPATGLFHGTATGDTVGTITFDCTQCSVQTNWRGPVYRTGGTTSGTVSGGGGTVSIPYPTSVPVASINTPISPATQPAAIIPTTPPTSIRPTSPPPRHTPRPISITSTPQSTPTQPPVPPVTDTCLAIDGNSLGLSRNQCGQINTLLPGIGQIQVEIPKSIGVDPDPMTFETFVHTEQGTTVNTKKTLGNVFEIIAYKTKSHTPVHQFAKPLKIILPIQQRSWGHTQLSVYTRETPDGSWLFVPNTIMNPQTVTLYVDHLSYFTIVDETPVEAVQSTTVTPHQPIIHPITMSQSCYIFGSLTPYFTWYLNLFGCDLIPLIVMLLILLALVVFWLVRHLSAGHDTNNTNIL